MRCLIDFALLLPMVVFAKDPPLPEALLNAKTAFVEKSETAEEYFDTYCKTLKVNAGATDKLQDKYCKALKKEAKADKQLFDKFYKELKKWGRFTLVQDRSSSDIYISLVRTSTERDSITRGSYAGIENPYGPQPPLSVKRLSWEEDSITIRDGRNNVRLYYYQTKRHGNLVSNLKHKMKQK
jgi:hypothetical protein